MVRLRKTNLVRLLLTYLTKSIISPDCSYEFKGFMTIAPEKNCPSPNSNANPKPNPNPNREGGGSMFFGGNCPDSNTVIFV